MFTSSLTLTNYFSMSHEKRFCLTRCDINFKKLKYFKRKDLPNIYQKYFLSCITKLAYQKSGTQDLRIGPETQNPRVGP